MTKVIIVGHGGYGTAIKNCLNMLLGETPGMFYVDFNIDDNLERLDQKLFAAMKLCEEDNILFACDLAGGSPFKQCAVICAQHPGYITVTGLNMAAYAEMVYNLDMTVEELAITAIETTRMSILRFPENHE